ncbi:amino acid adenylation domain-containing protein [Streptomyces alboniger]|uniref:Peptide synthetase n=1 Tax=Streptomyces alboniger TaxID=132473 RepID=A0A5J6HHP9_STRAD|nr:amino acid adenylation domain-containing protein [Streptomyces alboniger]QEV16707.1 peptide synthetase [Streptomyces alboniger]
MGASGPPHILDLVEPRLHAPGPAVADSEGTFGYRELDAASRAVARLLLARGARRDEPVVVHATASRGTVAALLGVVRAGCRFVPVDAGFPGERRRLMVRRSGARFLLAPDGHALALPGGPEPVPCGSAFSDAPRDDRFPLRRGSHAYTCFTSGSTGLPEPVTISATALGWSTAARLTHYPAPVGAFLLCSSISFDSSMAGIWWTLATGGLLVVPDGRPGDLLALARAAELHDATHVLMVPSLYGAALRGGLAPRLRTLTTVIVAGETCPPALVARHLADLPRAALYNEYGPTECTVWATVHTCTPADAAARTVPIGRPVTGVTAHIEPSEEGAPGELYLAGPGLAVEGGRADRFVIRDGMRCFRTGDLVTVRDDGELLFHGRTDHQLKLGGMRVERAEIEQALTSCDGITEAGVGVTGTARPRPIGFVVTDGGALDERRIRTQLLSSLPTTALPARVVAVPALPRLPNGKVDYRALDRRATTRRPRCP